jgi:hypothetical protein
MSDKRYLEVHEDAARLELLREGPLDTLRSIRRLALTGLSSGEYKAALAAIVEITGKELG